MMELAWFVYTIVVILAAVAASTVSVMSWVLTERRSALVSAAAFAIYILEVAVIFFAEYTGNKPFTQEFFEDGLTFPVYSIVLSVVLVTLIWAWLRMRVHRNIAVHNVIAFVAYFAIGSCLLAPYEGHAGTLITVLFWEFRDLTVAGCLVASYVWYRTRASESERLDIQRSRTTFIVACVLVASMCCEDLYTIVFMPIPAHGTWLYDFAWHLTERNLSENFLMMWCALRLVLSARQEMSVFGRHPASSKDLPSTPEQEKAKAVELKIPLFCEKFALSDREAEVVTLALNGKTTQQIADALVISTGTVKAHLHRIYVKCGVSNRKELIATFWRM